LRFPMSRARHLLRCRFCPVLIKESRLLRLRGNDTDRLTESGTLADRSLQRMI